MPKSKYEAIYKDLKQKIEEEEYAYQELLPSENQLVQTYNCSRNTIRRAVSRLVSDGYVQTMQGKGVRNIYRPVEQAAYTMGGIESFKESSIRNHKKGRSVVLQFMELTADQKISRRTGFPEGSELYYIQRLHFLDEKPLIINHNYFLKSAACGLTPEIAENSIYEYLENELGWDISYARKVITVEEAPDYVKEALELSDGLCVIVRSVTYLADTTMFQLTSSYHLPAKFQFIDFARRQKIKNNR